ncbi:MAG: ABC transporter permease [Planctomycetaceae bacterium]|nr:ABC transporter permease [Planctomycetaceae bacterium]
MRWGDLGGLAVASLRQRKFRTGLTLLGITIGSVLMLLTLAGGMGAADAVQAHYRGSEQMRTIRVDIGQERDTSDIPPDELAVPGEMSAERRERLKASLEENHPRMKYRHSEPMAAEVFDRWDQIPHVESLRPVITLSINLERAGTSKAVTLAGGPAGDSRVEETVVSGNGFSRDDAPEILIHEYLAYQWGFQDEATLDQLIGETVLVEHYSHREDPFAQSLQWASQGRGDLSPKEARQVVETLKQLAKGAAALGISEQQIGKLLRLVEQPAEEGEKPHESTSGPLSAAELKIVGLFRTPENEHYTWESGLSHLGWTDVIVPMKVARELVRPLKTDFWIHSTSVIVDSELEVESVQNTLNDQGYRTHSTVDFLRHVRERITFITSILTGLAFAAVAVAALGIANTMAMTVLERTREIGVMKAVGAGRRQVLGVFLFEGAILGGLGSGLGLLVGWLCTILLQDWVRGIVEGEFHHEVEHPVFTLPVWLLFGLPALVTGITTVASLLPARRAAGIDPIAALRSE